VKIALRLIWAVGTVGAAADVIWALDADELSGVGGQYLIDRSIASPSAEAADAALARRFWYLAEGLLKQPLQT
jgi:hypothetical protein